MSDSASMETEYPSAGRAWYLVVILSLGVLLSFTDRLILNLVVDDIRADLALSDLGVSLLQGLGFALIYAIAGLPMGRIADRTNRRNLVVAGILLWSIATIGCGLAGSFGQFFAARMLVGLGEAILMPAAASMIADSFPARTRGRAMGAFGIGAVLGSGIALTVGALLLSAVRSGLLSGFPLLSDMAPWRNVLILAGLPGILVSPLFLVIREPKRHQSVGFQPLTQVLAHMAADRGRIARVSIAIGVVAAGDYGLMSWLPALLDRAHGMSAIRIGSIVGGVIAIGGLIACIASGALSDEIVKRLGIAARARVMTASYLMCAAAAALFFLPGLAALLIGFVLWIFGSVAGCVVGNTVLQESVPSEMRATTAAFTTTCSALIGLGVGPTLVVLAAKLFGDGDAALRLGIALVCSLAAIGALMLLHNTAAARKSRPLEA